MSKKKNTLKDLDDFLKQQAASLVQPTPLSEKVVEKETPKPVVAVSHEEVEQEETISAEIILRHLHKLSQQEGPAFRKKFYDLIIRSLESQSKSTPEDKMLINTALYLKSGNQWKDVIRDYWKSKAH